jgi:hypothetical protein
MDKPYYVAYDRTVEAVRLDFLTESSRLLFWTHAPDATYRDFDARVKIHGGIAAVSMRFCPSQFRVLLINLKTEGVILLTPARSDVMMIGGYLVLASADAALGIIHIDVFSEQSLAELWSPGGLVATWNPVPPGDIPKVCSETIELSSSSARLLTDLRLSAHRSPLHEATYRIWMYALSFGLHPGPVWTTIVAKFHLSLPPPPNLSASPNSSPHLHVQSIWRGGSNYRIDYNVSYSGHIAGQDQDHRDHLDNRVLMLSEVSRGELADSGYWNDDNGNWDDDRTDLPCKKASVHVSEYSGALTYPSDDKIVIKYYI